MTLRTLIKRSLRFHWRSHLGVVIGAAIGSAALIGALIVGDSVKGSLRERALERLGEVGYAMHTHDRFVTDKLANGMNQPERSGSGTGSWDSGWDLTPDVFAGFGLRQPVQALTLVGIAARGDGTARASSVQLIGVPASAVIQTGKKSDDWFYHFFGFGKDEAIKSGGVWINKQLAGKLGLKIGDEVLVRATKPSALAGDAALSAPNDRLISMRLRVDRVLDTPSLANFSLQGGSAPILNAFVNRDELQKASGLDGRINLLLQTPLYASNRRLHHSIEKLPAWLRDNTTISSLAGNYDADSVLTLPKLSELLEARWTLADLDVEFQTGKSRQTINMVSSRVFLDPPLIRSALAADTNAQPLLTYLANLITVGSNAAPYSMVTAAGAPWTPADLRDDEIILNQWLADDLQAKPRDALTLVYFDPESGARLTERTNTFRVHSIVPMQMPWADRTLMPQFPGIEKAETTAEWDTAFPLVHKIRPQDDDYWRDHRGTPKAFITLTAGQKMWANRFGNLTAIRFPVPTNLVMVGDEVTSLHPGPEPTPNPSKEGSQKPEAPTSGVSVPLLGGVRGGLPGSLETPHVVTYTEKFRAALEKKILATLKPEELGLRFEPVREQALKAAEQSQDFGGLFIGFSLFVIVAALLLMAMLFQFSLEQRATEIGTLLALGFTPKQVRRLFLREGAALAFIGGLLGTLGGIGYAKAMLHGLTTIWRDAVGASSLKFFVTPQTLAIGLFASTLVAVFTLWLALRKQAKQPARELLAGTLECCDLSQPSPLGRPAAQAATGRAAKRLRQVAALQGGLPFTVALGLIAWAVVKGDTANAGIFFGAGALVLVAGLMFVNGGLKRLGISNESEPTPNPSQEGSFVVGRVQFLAPLLGGVGGGFPVEPAMSVTALALRGLSRRRSRSVATVALIASGVFLIVSIGVFRLDANRDATQRSSGTGGFALIGESTMPVVADLNTKAGRESFALNEADFAGVNVVQFRVRAGDEASCLNLNRAQKPKLLGVKPGAIEGRFTFIKGDRWTALISTRLQPGVHDAQESGNRLSGFKSLVEASTGLKPGANETGNSALRAPHSAFEIPAIGDANSIQWAMGKKVGDTLDYVDERGQPFKVRIVGAVANSILQGQLIIDEAEFVKRFPGESGYKFFLIDAPTNRVADVSAKLSRAMQDAGLELTPAPHRLAQFNAVQNTYLGTFQILGGLGLLLGSAGLGIVVLRNVLERRGELAVLLAVGWLRQQVRRLVLIEHAALLGLGLAIGIAAAVVAVLPSLQTPGAEFPWVSLGATLLAVCANGFLWAWLATRVALRGNLLSALRNE